jgi:hypothetical protein
MALYIQTLALLVNLILVTVASAAPELAVEQGSFDFGTTTQGKTVQHKFIVKNDGDAPLLIKQLSAACGCTVAKPSSSLVPPGRSAEIQVIFDSSNFSGKVKKTVTLTTNASKVPNYTFELYGNILEPMQVIPRELDLGPIRVAEAKRATLTVINVGGSSVRLLSANVSSTSLQIKVTIKKAELKPGAKGLIELSVTARPGAKVLSGYLHILTNSPQKKEITVPVYASAAK